MAKIKCPNCKHVVAETTDAFNSDTRPSGHMLRLVEPYKSRGWAKIIVWTSATPTSQIFCPRCEFPLAPHGRFDLVGIDRVSQAVAEWQRVIDEFNQHSESMAKRLDMQQGEAELLDAAEDIPQEIWDKARRLTEGIDAIKESASEESCPKCGKVESEFKNRSGFVNHCRKCRGRK